MRTFLLALVWACPALAQLSPTATWASSAVAHHQGMSNLTYLKVGSHESKLDIYRRRDAPGPHPTMIYIHGGGWTGGFKEDVFMHLLPFIEMGWNVVNVEYRMASVALAPAAVEDCLCALRWIAAHAAQYRIDPMKLVVMGDSAGGHLALTTGMIPATAGLDAACAGDSSAPLPKVAAIVNWYGITDVADILDGPNRKGYAVQWLGTQPNKLEIAQKVSPLTYVREGIPPIITIHGDADPTVPYTHAVRLHQALTEAKIPNQFITIPKGQHGNFPVEERLRAYTAIREFLAKQGLPVPAAQ